MKSTIIYLFVLAWAALATSSPLSESSSFTIKVTDESGNPLIGANVLVYDDGKVIYEGITDLNGMINIEIENEEVDIMISYTGFKTEEINSYKISDGTLTISLKPGAMLEEVIMTGTSRSKIKRAFESDAAMPIASDISSSVMKSDGISIRGRSTIEKLPGSGQITAGEWNDLHNWRDWKELINGETFRSMKTTWNIHTDKRYSVLVLNKNDFPIPGAMVKLLDKKGQLLWQAYTDVSGKAELFQGSYGQEESVHQVVIEYEDKTESIRQITHSDRGAMVAYLDVPCPSQMSVDISWIVDATGSMSDEISYLQAELLDVINRVQSESVDIRWSSIFYRDKGDEYVTRKQPFTKDVGSILQFIRSQGANGGGDFPEAVSDAVYEMVNDLEWHEESKVKLCFLLLDAPPHSDQVSMDKYRKSVQAAAAKGIKIIPITASGINRETEFLMKFTSILTNGTYVFITDDSGIGNPHLDPVVKDYEVEKLNDLFVRLIRSYTKLSDCKEYVKQSRSRDIRFYPNPASEMVTVENLLPGDQIQLISTSGMIVKSEIIQDKEVHQLNINDLVSGNYLLRVKGEDRTKDFRLLVIT